MELKEYNEKLKEITSEAEKKKLNLMKEFALSNNPYKIGDKITDHAGTIIVEKMHVGFATLSGVPGMVYFGIELNKDGKSNKRGNKRSAYQCNLIK